MRRVPFKKENVLIDLREGEEEEEVEVEEREREMVCCSTHPFIGCFRVCALTRILGASG